jgi:hypothetical protein
MVVERLRLEAGAARVCASIGAEMPDEGGEGSLAFELQNAGSHCFGLLVRYSFARK